MIIDACSIILLAKSTVLEEFAKWKEITITKGVYNEVLEGKIKGFIDALLLERLINEKIIKLSAISSESLVNKFKQDFGLGLGEAESIALATENNEKIIITDNKQGRKSAKIQGLKLLGSIEVIIALFKSKRISKEKTLSALKTLKKNGWFQDYLIEEVIKEIQNE